MADWHADAECDGLPQMLHWNPSKEVWWVIQPYLLPHSLCLLSSLMCCFIWISSFLTFLSFLPTHLMYLSCLPSPPLLPPAHLLPSSPSSLPSSPSSLTSPSPPCKGDTPPELKGSKYRVDLSWNPHEDKDFMFYDRHLVTSCLEHQPVSASVLCTMVW